MRPLPAVLLDLHEELATGKLVLRRGRVSKSVDLVNGNPVSTASTPRDETLGHFLVVERRHQRGRSIAPRSRARPSSAASSARRSSRCRSSPSSS